MRKVLNETYIPSNDVSKIKRRLIEQIESMSDAEVRIVAKSEASFRSFVADSFKSIAKFFGYVVRKVVNFGRDIARPISSKSSGIFTFKKASVSSKPAQIFKLEKAPKNVPLPTKRSKAKILRLENWD
ncbi:MAG: hypothetical protein F6K24_00995 [Okeania sp. SIO2D1]|nr:hypothetical protein [Okeania sp. SIO2D1]